MDHHKTTEPNELHLILTVSSDQQFKTKIYWTDNDIKNREKQ